MNSPLLRDRRSLPTGETWRAGWHLEQIAAPRAWKLSRGRNVVIAIIDEAIDTRHPEFRDRVLASYDVATGEHHALPEAGQLHGTQCAGFALAGGRTVTGVAPEASLMAIRAPSLGGRPEVQEIARAIRWAAERGADIICCPFGPPPDASPTLASPGSAQASAEDASPAPASREPAESSAEIGEAIDLAAKEGRGSKGSVVIFSAGNEGGTVHPWALHPEVLAVGACNARGRLCRYSNFEPALWCTFPSGDPDLAGEPDSLVLTTAPMGSFLEGKAIYSLTVGFTSLAAAGVAGLCALILSANPELRADEVKDVLRGSLEKPEFSSPRLSGCARPNARWAVELALSWSLQAGKPNRGL